MKRQRLVTLAIMLMLMISGCGCKHNWEPATCISDEYCTVCGEVQTPAMGHTANEGTKETDYITARTYVTVNCSVCGELLSREELEVIDLDNGQSFYFTPEEFIERGNLIFSELHVAYPDYVGEYELRYLGDEGMEGIFTIGIFHGGEEIGFIALRSASDGELGEKDMDTRLSIGKIIAFNSLENEDDIKNSKAIFLSLLKTCCPSVEVEQVWPEFNIMGAIIGTFDRVSITTFGGANSVVIGPAQNIYIDPWFLQ